MRDTVHLVPSPVAIEMEITIDAPPEAVWEHLVDWENLGRWMTEASDFRVLSSQREGIGVVAEATIRIGFIRTTDRIRVTRWDPPRLLGLEHLGWVKGEGVMRPVPLDSRTLLRWREALIGPPIGPKGVLGALGIRLWKPMMRRRFLRDLRLLKILVEADSSD